MKKLFVIFLLFFLSLKAQTVNELRAVWVTNVDSYVLSSDRNIAIGMDYLASIGVNVVFPVVWNNSYTLYPSNVMKNLFNVSISPTYNNRDPLYRVILEAHRNGMEVIPWFEYGFSSSYSQNGGTIIQKFPNWALKNSSGTLVVKNGFDWMAGTNPDVQNFMIALNTEVCDNYDVDGVQGDDRLPAMPVEGGYDSVTVAIYKAENNGQNPPSDKYNPQWMRWRADKLNNFYKRMRDSVKLRGSNLIFAAAPSNYPWGYDNYLQDSKTWVDQGIIDNFIPQLYRTDFNSYSYELNKSLSYVPLNKRNIFFAGVLGKSGTYVISPELLFQSYNLNRQLGVKGESIFFYEAYRANYNYLGDSLKKTLYSSTAIPPYRNGNVWRPKATIVNEDDPEADTTGKWTKYNIAGYKPYIYTTNDSNYCSITYNFIVPFDAYFDVFTYLVINSINSKSVKYQLFSQNGNKDTIIDQTITKNAGWYKLGTIYLTKGNKPVIKLDNSVSEKGKYINADACMLMINRKLSPDVIITSIDKKDEIEISDFRLEQNYPNPFNPNTVINYQLPAKSFITLKVYDILGKEIKTLVNEEKSEGNYSISFDGSELSSGIYFYKLTMFENLQVKNITKKMMLIK